MERYLVTIHCFNNEGKQSVEHIPADDLVGATRVIITYKPKRGFDPVKFTMEKEVVLI